MKALSPLQKYLTGIFLAAAMMFGPAAAKAEEMNVAPPVREALSSIFNVRAVETAITELSSGFMNAGSNHPEADMAIWATARRSPLSQRLIDRVVQAESNYVANANPRTSSACGLTQMIDSVLFEKLYEYGDEYGFHGHAYIEKYMDRNRDGSFTPDYRLRSRANYTAVRKLCTDPYFATTMGMEHLRDTIYNLQINTGGPVQYHEAYMGYVFGSTGGTRLMNAHASRRDHSRPAADFVGSGAVRANHNLFYSYVPAYTSGRGEQRRYHNGHWTARSVDSLFSIFLRKIGPGQAPVMDARPASTPAPAATPPMPEGGTAAQPAPNAPPENAPRVSDPADNFGPDINSGILPLPAPQPKP